MYYITELQLNFFLNQSKKRRRKDIKKRKQEKEKRKNRRNKKEEEETAKGVDKITFFQEKKKNMDSSRSSVTS